MSIPDRINTMNQTKMIDLLEEFPDVEFILDTAECHSNSKDELNRMLTIQERYHSCSDSYKFFVLESDYKFIMKLYGRLWKSLT